jgi:alpha-galactosidase
MSKRSDGELIGLIGLGLMGTSLTERLLEHGYRVAVWNRTREKAAPWLALGAKCSDNLVTSCRRMIITALLLAPLGALSAADTSAELALSRDFRMGVLRAMPNARSQPGLSFEKHAYPELNTVEWQVRLQASADRRSPLHENLKSADFVTRFPSPSGVTLHWSQGSHTDITDFQPQWEPLSKSRPFTLESYGGRSSDGAMPYFNLASDGGGLIVAVGWSGDWKTSFEALPEGRVRITAGLKEPRFRLRAGEQVRMPSVLVMAYRGDWLDGQNQFRRLMLEHFTPTNHPPLQLMPVAASVHGMIGFNATTETILSALAHDLAALKLPHDTFWLDAGWNIGGFPLGQGNPEPDTRRFPRGMAPVGDAVRKTGMRFLVWFEPERVMRGTWLEREHVPWLLEPSATPASLRYQERDGFQLLDLGDAEARTWVLATVSKQIREAGVAIYRQDFNFYPSFFWHTGESPDEVGLREVRYINGLYAFLDELARRHPGLILDNCASGGRRLDFEMMRRCVALWRSDSCWDAKSFPRNVQAMTHGLSLWLPLHGLGAAATDELALRSGIRACASFALNFRDPAAVNALRKHLARYLKVRPFFMKDFYPLTPWSDNPAQLLAFQFHDPASGGGIVQAFLGAEVVEPPPRLILRGLNPSHRLTVTGWDAHGKDSGFTGAELMEHGLPLPAPRNSGTIPPISSGTKTTIGFSTPGTSATTRRFRCISPPRPMAVSGPIWARPSDTVRKAVGMRAAPLRRMSLRTEGSPIFFTPASVMAAWPRASWAARSLTAQEGLGPGGRVIQFCGATRILRPGIPACWGIRM